MERVKDEHAKRHTHKYQQDDAKAGGGRGSLVPTPGPHLNCSSKFYVVSVIPMFNKICMKLKIIQTAKKRTSHQRASHLRGQRFVTIHSMHPKVYV